MQKIRKGDQVVVTTRGLEARRAGRMVWNRPQPRPYLCARAFAFQASAGGRAAPGSPPGF
jgi:hypothetical protein